MPTVCTICRKRCDKLIDFISNEGEEIKIAQCLKIFHSDFIEFLNVPTKCCNKCGVQMKTAYQFAQKLRGISHKHQKKSASNKAKPEAKLTQNELPFILPKPEEPTAVKSRVPAKSEEALGRNARRVYTCIECVEEFKSFAVLKSHKAMHQIPKDYSNICENCFTLFENEDAKTRHCSLVHSDGSFRCPLCRKHFTTQVYVWRHVRRKHQRTLIPYHCKMCGKTEFDIKTIHTHFDEMHRARLPKVPAEKPQDQMLENHGEDDVNMDVEFLDELLLENSFEFMENWDYYLNFDLPDEPTNGEKSLFNCSICQWDCDKPKSLLLHFTVRHKLKLFGCNQCHEELPTMAEFKTHLATQHKAMNNEALNASAQLFLPKHLCPFDSCRKHFNTHKNLLQHLRVVHNRVKRHICQLCDRQFSTQDHLKKHFLSLHQNERKHICGTCFKSFTQLCHLKQHMSVHSDKTYSCNACGAKFCREINAQRHFKRKHQMSLQT